MVDYATGLERGPANHQPLTPLLFLERTAAVYPGHIAVIHGALRRDYRTLRARCVRLASALAARGIGRGDTVAALLPNIPEMAPNTGGPSTTPKKVKASVPPVAMLAMPGGAWRATSAR